MYNDPTGKNINDILTGYGNAYTSNIALGLGRVEPDDYLGDQSHYAIGQFVGDLMGLYTGGAEVLTGGSMVGGGAVITVGTGGAGVIAGAPMSMAGVAVVAHGASVFGTSAYRMSRGYGGVSNKSNTNKVRPEYTKKELEEIVEDIHAHSYNKHEIIQRESEILLTPEEHKKLIRDTILNPDIKFNRSGDKIYYNVKENFLVIKNSNPTGFKPSNGVNYLKDNIILPNIRKVK
jgi:hypothetical protein